MARKKTKKPEKSWAEMTYEEKRAQLPEKINKLGEFMLTDEFIEGIWVVKDMKAVMK